MKHFFASSLKFVAILVGLAVLVLGTLVVYSEVKMRKEEFVPLETIMKAAHYLAEEVDDSTGEVKVYRKNGIEIRLTDNMNYIEKNQFRTDVRGSICSVLKRIWIRKTVLENVLNLDITYEPLLQYRVLETQVTASDWYVRYPPIIRHAGGGLFINVEETLQKAVYTNSLEALKASYEMGCRVIEMDLSMASDGVLCAVHNGEKYWDSSASSGAFSEGTTIYGLTTLLLEDLVDFMNVFRDTVFIIDMKDHFEEGYRQIVSTAEAKGCADILDRIVPQLYAPENYDTLRDLYPWKTYILTLYTMKDVSDEAVVDFVSDKNDIPVVTMPKKRVSDTFSRALHDVGKRVFTHTVNDLSGIWKYVNDGVDGFYSDFITPKSFEDFYDLQQHSF